MRRLYSIPLSTNVERVALALAHKGLEVETVEVPYEDRSLVEKVSGQSLVPVLDDDGTILADSTVILAYLEERYPQRPLFPKEPARRAEVDVFIDWFNSVWKRPPNLIYVEMTKDEPDLARIDQLGKRMTGYLDLFESMLSGRDHLMGDEFSVADCIAFPFVKYALLHPEEDPYLFHRILVDHQPLAAGQRGLEAWIRRVDRRPRA